MLRFIDLLNKKTVVLASGSPARQEMLRKLGLNVTVCPSEFEENLKLADFDSVPTFIEATALEKVLEVENRLFKLGKTPDFIIGADTMVTLNGVLYGKPKSEEDAVNTLKMLSGKPHTVYSSVAIKMGTEVIQFTESTRVHIGNLKEEEMRAYVATGEPMNKAGSYGIQGIGACIVEKIEGDFYTVMGLPLYRLSQELAKLCSRL